MSIKTTPKHLTVHVLLCGRALVGVFPLVIDAGAVNAQVQLKVQPGVQLIWLTKTKDTCQLQWSSNPVGIWADLVTVTGNGATNTVYDPAPSGTRLSRVWDIVSWNASRFGQPCHE